SLSSQSRAGRARTTTALKQWANRFRIKDLGPDQPVAAGAQCCCFATPGDGWASGTKRGRHPGAILLTCRVVAAMRRKLRLALERFLNRRRPAISKADAKQTASNFSHPKEGERRGSPPGLQRPPPARLEAVVFQPQL